MVQESSWAGSWHVCLLHPLQHRYAEQNQEQDIAARAYRVNEFPSSRQNHVILLLLDYLHAKFLSKNFPLLSWVLYKVVWAINWLHWWKFFSTALAAFSAFLQSGGQRRRNPASFYRTFTTFPLLMTSPTAHKAKCPITEPISELWELSGARKHPGWPLLLWRKELVPQFSLRLSAEPSERAPPSDQNVIWTNLQVILCSFSLALENKSVVLASTAIQLMDDRKSPIVAGSNL